MNRPIALPDLVNTARLQKPAAPHVGSGLEPKTMRDLRCWGGGLGVCAFSAGRKGSRPRRSETLRV